MAMLPKNCASAPAHKGLSKSADRQLQKLAEYEQLCGGIAANELMTFAPMPTTYAEATTFANTLAKQLKEFSRFSISPLVVFEPSAARPAILAELRAGRYDGVLAGYYKALQQAGIHDAHMGTWVLFPEGNTPAWRTTDSGEFAANVTALARLQKQYFPTSRVSVLLDSHSYPSNDTDWSDGKMTSLVPYIKNIPHGLVDRFGLQGFPWVAPGDNAAVARLKTNDYLPAGLAKEVAEYLGIREVWLNTGTFRRMHAGMAGEVTMDARARGTLLAGVAQAAKALADQSFHVRVNVFSENKAKVAEGVDWSYWQTGGVHADGSHADVLDMFLRTLRLGNIGVSLYDIR